MDSVLLQEEALKLSPFERAQLIDALWQSLDSDQQEEIDNAWIEESNDRLTAYHQGEIEAVDVEKTILTGFSPLYREFRSFYRSK